MEPYYRSVKFCGDFRNTFDRVTLIRSEGCAGIYNCNFQGEQVKVKIFPIQPFRYPEIWTQSYAKGENASKAKSYSASAIVNDNRNYHFFVQAESDSQANNLAKRIQEASSQVFRREASRYLAEKRQERNPSHQEAS